MSKIGLDKVLHAVCCFVIAVIFMMGFYYFVPSIAAAQIVGFAAAMLVGVAKEIYDIKTTGFDLKDLAADGVGAILAVLCGFGL